MKIGDRVKVKESAVDIRCLKNAVGTVITIERRLISIELDTPITIHNTTLSTYICFASDVEPLIKETGADWEKMWEESSDE